MRSFHCSKLQKPLFQTNFFQFIFGFCPRGHLIDYHLPNVDNRGHLTNYYLPHFIHAVIERPPAQSYTPALGLAGMSSSGGSGLYEMFDNLW